MLLPGLLAPLGRCFAMLAAALGASQASAADREGLVESELRLTLPPAEPGGQPYVLAAYLARPDRPGRFPVALVTHGSPRDPAARAGVVARTLAPHAREMARRGWAAVSIVRRGFGTSDGPYVERVGACTDRSYAAAGRIAAQDLRGALQAIGAAPWADSGRSIVIGISAGGFAATALAAEPPPGLRAVVSLAGGRGSRAPLEVCQPERLVDAYAAFGRTARVPALWIYAENDLYIWPDLARALHGAFTGAGAPARLVFVPPFGEDGHHVTRHSLKSWLPHLDAFLRDTGLPTWSPAALALPGAAADPRLAEALAAYLASPGEKAFVIEENGRAFGWATRRATTAQAEADAIALCRAKARRACRAVIVNLEPVPAR